MKLLGGIIIGYIGTVIIISILFAALDRRVWNCTQYNKQEIPKTEICTQWTRRE